MNGPQALVAGAGAAVGGAVALVLSVALMKRAPARLERTNYRGRAVPAVLGIALTCGALTGLGLIALLAPRVERVSATNVAWAILVVMVLLAAAGAADDLRGDERPRGFKGHVAAALKGRLTGGTIKIVAGGTAGLVAGSLVTSRPRIALEIALLVALSANLANLLDRAPGRATKIGFAAAVPLVALGSPHWAVASAAMWGAALACLPLDLRERGMLGDAGANPMGGVIGLGLGLSLAEPGRLIALGFLLGLNIASEGTSFSAVIERNSALRWIDDLGRSRGT